MSPLFAFRVVEQASQQAIVKANRAIRQFLGHVNQKGRQDGMPFGIRKSPELAKAVSRTTRGQLLQPGQGNALCHECLNLKAAYPVQPSNQILNAGSGTRGGNPAQPAQHAAAFGANLQKTVECLFLISA